MDWIKSLLEVNDIYKPLIPLGIILIFVNMNGSLLIYSIAVAAVIIGFIGFFIKNRWTKVIAGFLFAATGSYMVLSLFGFYITHFGVFLAILVVLIALLIIIGGLFAMYRAIVDEGVHEEDHDQEYDGYDKEYYAESEENYTED